MLRCPAAIRVVVVVVSGLTACEPVDLEGALLSCRADDECPEGQICGADSLCAPASVDNLAVDSSAVVPTRIGRPFVDDGSPLEVRFVLSGLVRTPPTVRLNDGLDDIDDAVADADADADADNAWVARFVVDSDGFEGTARVLVDAVDERGRPSTFVLPEGVTFDFTGPLPVAAALQRLPDPSRTVVALEILEETDVGPAIDVRLVFSTTEPVILDDDDAPKVTTTGVVPLVFDRDLTASNPLIFDLPWPDDAASGIYDGVHDIEVTLTDLAGNTTTTPVRFLDTDDVDGADHGFVVDATAPPLPRVSVEDAIVFERAPWGRLDQAVADQYRVMGAVGSVEAGAHVLVSRDADARLGIDRVIAGDDGAFFAPRDGGSLPISDAATVYLRAADAAGNVSAPVGVRDVRWFATPLGKVVGSTLENPHAFHELPLLKPFLGQGGAFERGDVDVGSSDDRRLATIGAGTWRRANTIAESLKRPDLFARGVANGTLVTDPVQGTTWLFGRMSTRAASVPGANVGFGACADVEPDLHVRDAAGRWRPAPLPPTPAGLDFDALAAVFVPPLGRVMVTTTALATFTFDGAAWTADCTGDCVDGDDDGDGDDDVGALEDPDDDRLAKPRSLVWDAARRRLVVVMQNGRFAERALSQPWQLNAQRLSAETTAVYDPGAEAVVFASGPLLQRWDGATLTPLCDGDCADAAPPARPGAVVAFDELSAQYVLFGGLGDVPCSITTSATFMATRDLPPEVQQPAATDAPTETWTFKDNRWTRHDVVGPPGRTRHAMRWDPLRGRVALVGGDDCECLGQGLPGTSPSLQLGFSNDTWEWDGTQWIEVLDSRRPANTGFTFLPGTPPPVRDHVVVEGGFLGGPMVHTAGEAFVFRDEAWWRRSSSSGNHGAGMTATATSPTGEIFAVAGMNRDGGFFASSSRILDRLSDSGDFVRACDDDSCKIPVRTFGAAAWHDGDRFYVHGGALFDPNLEDNDDDDNFRIQVSGRVPADAGVALLQSFSPAEGWVTRCTESGCSDGAPSRRVLHRAVLDGDGRVVMFGGLVGDQTTTAETWAFDGTTWSPVSGASPPARAGHVLAWDAARDAVVAAYGTDLGGQPHRLIAGLGILPLEPHDIPAALSEVWELNGETWTPAPHVDVEGDGRPSPRSSVAGAGLPDGGVLLLGGSPSPAQTFAEAADFSTTTPVSDEAWVWDGAADTGPAHRFAARADLLVSLRRPDDELRSLTITWRTTASRTNAPTTTRAPTLLWWDGNTWVVVADDERVDCGDGCVSAVLDAARARRAVGATGNGSLVVAATTEPNGPAPGRAVLSTDTVEVQLSWRRPEGTTP